MTVKIDKGIPVPPKRGECPYPFEEMEVGDSIFVATTKGKKANPLTSYCDWWGKKLKITFTVRTVEEDGVKGVRAWRIK